MSNGTVSLAPKISKPPSRQRKPMRPNGETSFEFFINEFEEMGFSFFPRWRVRTPIRMQPSWAFLPP